MKPLKFWEWTIDFIPHFTEHLIKYACRDYSKSMLVKRAPVDNSGPFCSSLMRGLLSQSRIIPWWRHEMETFSVLLNSLVTGEFPAQMSVTQSFDVFFDLRLNKRLSKQSWGWWSETSSRSLWRHCNGWLYEFYNKACMKWHKYHSRLNEHCWDHKSPQGWLNDLIWRPKPVRSTKWVCG